jgi:RNA polymerase sigma-70 factor, ECF subfamily
MKEELNLIKGFQSGSVEAFSELYDQYVEKIYNFIYYRTHHKETAEDLTSLVFTKALENSQSFNSQKGSLNSWLYQIARNSIIDHYRTFKFAEGIESAFDVSSNVNIEKDTDVTLQMEKARQYLNKLPKEAREVVIMRVWDGLSYKEIADLTGKSEASLKMLFSRSLSRIQANAPAAMLLILLLNNNLQ